MCVVAAFIISLPHLVNFLIFVLFSTDLKKKINIQEMQT